MISKLNVKAILVGWLAYYGLFYALMLPVTVGFALALQPSLFAGRRGHATPQLFTFVPYYITLVVVAGVIKILSGFITAHLARKAPLQNAIVLGILTIISTTALRQLIHTHATPYGPLSVLSTLPLMLLGAYWRIKVRKPDTQSAKGLARHGPSPPIPLP